MAFVKLASRAINTQGLICVEQTESLAGFSALPTLKLTYDAGCVLTFAYNDIAALEADRELIEDAMLIDSGAEDMDDD